MNRNNSNSEIPSILNSVSDLRAFRKCLGHYGTGVAVVAAQFEGERCGMTINSFSALSLSPPLVMWSIRNESSAREFFTTTPFFSINVLASDQIDVSARFAKSDGDPFDQGEWIQGEHGEPLLNGSCANLTCSLVQTFPGGDHTILIGQVTSFGCSDITPLLFVQGEYRIPFSHPRNNAGPSSAGTPAGMMDASLMRLLYSVATRWIDEFDIDRAAENLSRSQSRMLAWLSEGAHTLDELVVNIGLSGDELEEDVSFLISQGYVYRLYPTVFALTPLGQKKRESLAGRIKQFEDDKLANFDSAKVAVFRQLLIDLLR